MYINKNILSYIKNFTIVFLIKKSPFCLFIEKKNLFFYNINMIKNMTSGNPLKLILQFSIPLILGNMFQQTYNLVDSAIVGKTLGSKALGSIGATSSIQFLVIGFCIGLCLGFGIPIAKEFGSNNLKKMRSYIYNSIFLLLLISIIITIICIFSCHTILHLLNTHTDLYNDTYNYILIIFIGIPFNILYNYTSTILRSLGNSKTPFLFLVFSSILNIFLDFYFILNLKLGVTGAAIATILSQAVSGILCFFVLKKYEILKFKNDEKIFDLEIIINLLSMGFPMGFNYSITAIGSMFIQSANNSLGVVYTSAFAAATKIKQFAMAPFDAIATGVSTFTSQNLGAKKIERIYEGIKKGFFLGVCYGIFIGIILFLFGDKLSYIFLDKKYIEEIKYSFLFLKISAIFFWDLGIVIIIRMTVQGLSFPKKAVITGILEMIPRIFIGLFLVNKLGFLAVCIAEPAAWIMGSIYITYILISCLKIIKSQIKN